MTVEIRYLGPGDEHVFERIAPDVFDNAVDRATLAHYLGTPGHHLIVAIAQGSSEYNVSFVVEAQAMRDAVAVVHDEFNLHLRSSRFESEERFRGPVWVPQIV